MVADKYVDKDTVLEWILIQKSGATITDIPDAIMDEAHAKVDAEIVNKRCFDLDDGLPTESDANDFLKFATFSWALALLCKAGSIGQTSGEILTNQFGDVKYQFQRTNPLFFFATGSSDPFMDLLPYETLRMYGMSFIRGFCKFRFWEKTGGMLAKPVAFRDKTSRGAFWNEPYEISDIADAEYGETLPEEDY